MIVPVSSKSPRMDLNAHAWAWENKVTQEDRHNDLILANENRDAMFHPSYSSGTAVVRGDTPFVDGHDYYWEIQVLSCLYGTDVMIGVGTDKVDLTYSRHEFVSALGLDQKSWGYSYTGMLQHNGISRRVVPRFNKGSTVGMHLNMWTGTLSYFVDGKPLGVAFSALKGRTLYPMVCSTAANSTVRLIYSYSCTSSLQQHCLHTLNTSVHMMKLVSTIPGLRGLVDKTLLSYQNSSETHTPVQEVESKENSKLNETSLVVIDTDSDEECFGEVKQLRRKKRKYNINLHCISSASTSKLSSPTDVTERGCVQCGAMIRPHTELRDNEIRLLPSARIPTRIGLCLFCDVIF